jgi:predicted MFS family arabinose efflux permease
VNAQTASSQRFVLMLMFLVVTLELLDRQLINILAQDIKVDLRLSDTELGLITGTAAGVVKAIVSIPIAWWADRFDRAKMLAVLLATWSAFTAACGLANSFVGLALTRMAFGFGDSGGIPVSTALLRDQLPKRPTSALALMMVGNPFGTFLAFLFGGLIAQHWGWRMAFIVAGVPGLIIAAVLWANLKDTRVARRLSAGQLACVSDVLMLLRRQQIMLLLGATFASIFIVSAGSAWLPAFFMRVHGLTTQQMGFYGAIAIGAGGSIGALSGLLCETLRSRTPHPESAIMLMTIGLVVPFLALTVFASTTSSAMMGLFFYNCVAYAWLAPTIRLIQDAVEVDDRALAIAVCGGVATFCALGAGIPVTGWISDLLSPQYGSWSIGLAAFVTISAAAVLGLFSHWRFLVEIRGKK